MMINPKIWIWLHIRYQRIVNSIAFIPTLSVLVFPGLALLMLYLGYAPIGKDIKSRISWLSLKDASTARNITATVAAGLVSLLVFSFSQVMILLNQGAGKMSNRILTGLIVNRFQQVVLGYYIGHHHPQTRRPGTAVWCIHVLADLFAFHLRHYPQVNFRDERNRVRIRIQEPDFAHLLRDCLLPILDYARADRIVPDALAKTLSGLQQLAQQSGKKRP